MDIHWYLYIILVLGNCGRLKSLTDKVVADFEYSLYIFVNFSVLGGLLTTGRQNTMSSVFYIVASYVVHCNKRLICYGNYYIQ